MLRVVILLTVSAWTVCAQIASLRGRVLDQTGAVIPLAQVRLSGAAGPARTTSSTPDGSYVFSGLTPGDYRVEASAPGLILPEPALISFGGTQLNLDLRLQLAATAQQVTVEANGGASASVDPASNRNALVLRGSQLRMLGDSPEDLAADLQALAGPSAGPDGGAIYIDGFSGGELPPKESILEIRINRNPFSPEYDKLGLGRIEIITKPGSSQFHGGAFYNFGNSFWNSRDPYASQKAPFNLNEFGVNAGGPLGSRASFLISAQHDSIDGGLIVNAITLDPRTLAVINPFSSVSAMPQSRTTVNPRLDFQIDSNNTLSIRYQWTQADIHGAGPGGLNLDSRAYRSNALSQTLQASETAVLGPNALNELHFQLFRIDLSLLANDSSPALMILGAFSGGGAQIGHSSNLQTDYELHNTTSISRGAHTYSFGIWGHGLLEQDISMRNFGGTFTFAGGLAPVSGGSGASALEPITSIESYRRTLLGLGLGQGGGPAQFSIATGNPLLAASQTDGAIFAGDDWRMRPNFTLSYGVRYEAQTNIHDWRDVAPRLGLAWAPGGGANKPAPKTVFRLGFGMYYDRFSLTNSLTAMRYNGVNQRQYVISNPSFFPTIPSPAALALLEPVQTVWEVSPALRAPYMMLGAAAVERQFGRGTTLSLTYATTHELHQLRSADINAPLPGTYYPGIPGSGVFPLGSPDPVFEMESSGLFNQREFVVNFNTQPSSRVSLFGIYVNNQALANSDGIDTFASNPYSGAGEYGPSPIDLHHRGSIGSTLTAWRGVRFTVLSVFGTGAPFNITTGTDLYGDTLFNARPGFATDPNKPGVIATRYGLLDPNPTPGEPIVPRNYGRGPGTEFLNLRIAKVFTFGPSGEGSISTGGSASSGTVFGASAQRGATVSTSHRYNLSVTLAIRNLLNHDNAGPVIGDLNSPLFGQANQSSGAAWLGGTSLSESANNRRVELQTRFTF